MSKQAVFILKLTWRSTDFPEYWVPLLYTELRNGRARMGCSKFAGANLRDLRDRLRHVSWQHLTNQEQETWGNAGFMLSVGVGDYLLYAAMPLRGQHTLVQVNGDYMFTEVWDIEGRGDFRHALPSRFLGTVSDSDPWIKLAFAGDKGETAGWRLVKPNQGFFTLLDGLSSVAAERTESPANDSRGEHIGISAVSDARQRGDGDLPLRKDEKPLSTTDGIEGEAIEKSSGSYASVNLALGETGTGPGARGVFRCGTPLLIVVRDLFEPTLSGYLTHLMGREIDIMGIPSEPGQKRWFLVNYTGMGEPRMFVFSGTCRSIRSEGGSKPVIATFAINDMPDERLNEVIGFIRSITFCSLQESEFDNDTTPIGDHRSGIAEFPMSARTNFRSPAGPAPEGIGTGNASKDFPAGEYSAVAGGRNCLPLASIPIREVENPSAVAYIKDISERWLKIVGITANVGEVKSFVIEANESLETKPFAFAAVCRWLVPGHQGTLAGFEIIGLAKEVRRRLNDLVKRVAECELSMMPEARDGDD